MKRFALLITALLLCGIAAAHTINWHDGNTTTQTTCNAGDNITPPTPIGKYGYHFIEWAEYQKIEYLESTGTQYIDTGFVPNQNSGINIDFYVTRSIAATVALQQTSGFGFGVSQGTSNNNVAFIIFGGSTTAWAVMKQDLFGGGDGRYKVIIDRRDASVIAENNSSVDHTFPTYTSTNNYSLILFGGRNSSSSFYLGATRIYSCKLYDNGVLVRDFIPALDKDGTPCMYERVEHKYYYNQGSGQFITGQAI